MPVRIVQARKKSALGVWGGLKCLGPVDSLNVARGCAGSCAFCYARIYKDAPSPHTVLLYSDLERQLRAELRSPQRKRPLPRWVLFTGASDPFLGGEEVLSVTRGCLSTLIEHNTGISFSTRGRIPREIVSLLGTHARHVRAFVPIACMDEGYTRTWEPGTALPQERLLVLRRLIDAGLHPRVRVEPLIPFVNDETEQLRATLSAVSSLGLRSVVVSYLQVRPGVAEQIRREVPADQASLALGAFPELDLRPGDQHWIPEKQASASFVRLERIAAEHGLRAVPCGCQNPDLPSGKCPILPPELPIPVGKQEQLSFDPGGEE